MGGLRLPCAPIWGGETGQGQALPVHVVGFALIGWFAGRAVGGADGRLASLAFTYVMNT